jgi:putative copper export protein
MKIVVAAGAPAAGPDGPHVAPVGPDPRLQQVLTVTAGRARGGWPPPARWQAVNAGTGGRSPAGHTVGMLAVGWGTFRLFLHVLAATVWVGGQLTLAALVPTLRALGTQVPRAAARRFNQVAWPAFGVLVVTGAWNIAAEQAKDHGAYRTTLVVKLVVVAISGVTAFLHARARSTAGLAVYGALTGVSALAALFLGVLLAG